MGTVGDGMRDCARTYQGACIRVGCRGTVQAFCGTGSKAPIRHSFGCTLLSINNHVVEQLACSY